MSITPESATAGIRAGHHDLRDKMRLKDEKNGVTCPLRPFLTTYRNDMQ